jgi:hypothetical protein
MGGCCRGVAAHGSPTKAKQSTGAPASASAHHALRSPCAPLGFRRLRNEPTNRAEISGTVQATNPGDHARGQGRQHQDDNGRAGPVYAGLARLFQLLRNARGADRSHSLGPVSIAGRSLAPVENTTASSGGTHSRAISDDEIARAAAYFSSLTPRKTIKVVEMNTVLKTYVAWWG